MTQSTTQSEALRRTWDAAAPGWARWEQIFTVGLADATETLLDMAGVRPGMRMLDLACGAGSQTLQAARRIGPGGRVVASDISATMLDHLRRNAAAAGLQNIETLEGAAEDLAERHGPFDAAISRLGLMLFPAPGKALQAVGRTLKPGARMAALVFAGPEHNRFMAEPMAILLRHAGKQPPAPGQPGIFALGGEGVLERLLADSGFSAVETRRVRAPLRLPDTAQVMEMMQQAFGAYRAVVADLGAAERARAWDEVRACVQTFETGAGFETEFDLLIGSGARPH